MEKILHIEVDVFGIQVTAFREDKHRLRHAAENRVLTGPHTAPAYGAAHLDRDPEGVAFFSMVLPETATAATIAHECVHMADWIMEDLGIPTDVANTEVRAYLVGHLVNELDREGWL